ncbi:MAG TPA: sugar O-acetyltransferase [Burkholderiales bacterium]|nr:sugar O-acetyltransferase [Burkholderiales bacterium]
MSASTSDAIEKNKMLAGALYRANDPLLREERLHARRLLKAYNDSAPDDVGLRLKLLGELLGKKEGSIEIEPPFRCDYGYNISVGDGFYANFNCVILDCARVEIGRNVFLAPFVQIYTATHPIDAATRNSGLESALPITIGNDVWIGGGAILNPGVTIGSGSVIGAGSVVTRNIPPKVLAVGNPCRPIRDL